MAGIEVGLKGYGPKQTIGVLTDGPLWGPVR